MSWLPADFSHPERVDLPTGHHLRPIREADVDIDLPAVMGSRERLWVVDQAVATDLERALDDFVPRWLAETWGLTAVDYSP